jgi:8-oxo-dGTP pyrophosphatase MutT (NUDIX family)
VSRHPLLRLANDREVKQASEFREAAEGLIGEGLAVSYQQEIAQAPRRQEAGLEYLVPYPRRLARGRRKNRDEEHLAQALIEYARKHGPLELPGGASFEPLHGPVPLASATPDTAAGEDDPNWGVGSLSLLGLGPEDRLALMQLKYVAPDATRPGVGETPLRGLLTALGHAAIAWANRAVLRDELVMAGARPPSEEPPLVMLMASPRYWTLCRKREAQKGAAWIKEHERLAREFEEETGVQVRYLAIELAGDPGWSYPEGFPVLDGPPGLRPAWEPGAGRLKPKPRPRPQPEVAQVVEPDLNRPPRAYTSRESFAAGDRIEHSTLGFGVVQGGAGPGKIQVLFGDRMVLLVHERG